jgi:hypothetical protein
MTDLFERPIPTPDYSVAYGSDPAQVADLWIPRVGVPPSLVVALHGGWWRAAHDRAHLAHLCRTLRDEGFAVVNLEYRRLGMLGGGLRAMSVSAAESWTSSSRATTSGARRRSRALRLLSASRSVHGRSSSTGSMIAACRSRCRRPTPTRPVRPAMISTSACWSESATSIRSIPRNPRSRACATRYGISRNHSGLLGIKWIR